MSFPTLNATFSPVIIMGMHRSGTSLLAGLLEEMGLFIGNKTSVNSETKFFWSLNNWILKQCGGSWDYPCPVKGLFQDNDSFSIVLKYLRFMANTPQIISFLGVKNYLSYGSFENIDIPWGWKDPRNTFTLPLWLDLFPKARIINIYRHGVDVAQSLLVRKHRAADKRKKNIEKPRLKLYSLIRKDIDFIGSVRCRNLEGGFSLWEEYMAQGKLNIENDGSRILNIKYEDFLMDSTPVLLELSRFCNLKKNDRIIGLLSKKIKRERAYAYMKNKELKNFASEHKERLAVYGY